MINPALKSRLSQQSFGFVPFPLWVPIVEASESFPAPAPFPAPAASPQTSRGKEGSDVPSFLCAIKFIFVFIGSLQSRVPSFRK